MRYDAAVVARTWPGILANDKPIMHLGLGGPDLIALMKRLPSDKVPMLMATAMVGLVWAPNGWYFSIRPTYSQEFAGLLDELQKKLPQKRALRIGAVSTQGKAPFVDQVNGVKKLAATYPDRFEVVEHGWIEANPVSVTANVRTALQDKPDVILVGGTTAQVVATLKALEELGRKIPVITSSHNGLPSAADCIDLAEIEGAYSVFSFAPSGSPRSPGDVQEEPHRHGELGPVASQSAAQTLLALRILERAVNKVGKDKVTGKAMYDAMLAKTFSRKSCWGYAQAVLRQVPPVPGRRDPRQGHRVKDRQIVPVGGGWLTSPELEKW